METCRTKVLGFSLLLGGLLLCGIGVWLMFSPAQYRAKVKITTNPDIIMGPGFLASHPGTNEYDPYGPYSFTVDIKEIQSESVLTNVVAILNLNDEWGKKYSWRGKLETKRTVELLRKRMNVQRVGETQYIEISATSETPNEALQVANAVVEAFRNYRIQTVILDGIKSLEEKFKQGEQEIEAQREKVEQLKEKIPGPVPELPSTTPTYNPLPDRTNRKLLDTNVVAYFEGVRKLERMEEFQKLVALKVRLGKDNLPNSKKAAVQIESPAVLPQTPVGPNRVLGALLFVVGLFPTIGGFLLRKSAHRQSV